MSFSDVFAKARRRHRRRGTCGAQDAGRARGGGVGRCARDSRSEAARCDPDPEDAECARLGRGAAADRRARPQGQRVRLRARSSALDRGAAQWRRAGRGVEPDPGQAAQRVPLCDAGDDAARACARCQRQPHHAAARPGRRWRRRAAAPSWKDEPAVRHGADRQHLLCRQHRRRGGVSLLARPHRRGGQEARHFKPRVTGRAACCQVRTARSSMPASARSATSPRWA